LRRHNADNLNSISGNDKLEIVARKNNYSKIKP